MKRKYLYGDEIIKVGQSYFKTITLIRKHRLSVDEIWIDLRASMKRKRCSLLKTFYSHDQVKESKLISYLMELNSEKKWVEDESLISDPDSTLRLMLIQQLYFEVFRNSSQTDLHILILKKKLPLGFLEGPDADQDLPRAKEDSE